MATFEVRTVDLVAHALYGATVCSRTGLAGGRKGAQKRWHSDRTAWCAVLFGVVPDVVSMGVPLAVFCLEGAHGNFFHALDGTDLIIYHYAHSVLVALAVSGLLWRPLFFPIAGGDRSRPARRAYTRTGQIPDQAVLPAVGVGAGRHPLVAPPGGRVGILAGASGHLADAPHATPPPQPIVTRR
jgi:hypothetical protein